MGYSEDATGVIEILQDRPVAYHPALAKAVGGVKEAIFLGQLLYWHGKGKRSDGWIWKSQAEMEEETALSRTEQETARRNLGKLGLIEEKLMGVPATLHYRLDIPQIVETLQTSLRKPRKQDCREPANKDAETLQSIPESTIDLPENTAESKASPPPKSTPKQVAVFLESGGAIRTPTRKLKNGMTIREKVSDAIVAIVGMDAKSLELWGNVVDGYISSGWSKYSYTTMLDYYRRKEIPGQPRRNGSGSRAPAENPIEMVNRLIREEGWDNDQPG